jgi:hypothetical protein
MTIQELKDLAAEYAVSPLGDKRRKDTWAAAVEWAKAAGANVKTAVAQVVEVVQVAAERVAEVANGPQVGMVYRVVLLALMVLNRLPRLASDTVVAGIRCRGMLDQMWYATGSRHPMVDLGYWWNQTRRDADY